MNIDSPRKLNLSFSIPQREWDEMSDKTKFLWELYGRHLGSATEATINLNIIPFKK
jgi:hypothetical protein